MKLEIAGSKDNENLISFFKEFPVPGQLDLKIDRNVDFFQPYKLQSEEYKTYILKDENHKIHAAASFVFREASTEGRLEKIAYATDLRVSNNRRAILQWSHHFLPVLRAETESNGISSIFSVINLADPSALNAFIRPRTMKRALPRYFLYRKFKLVGLHGRYPWAEKPLPSIAIREGSEANFDALLNYVVKRSYFRPFASVWDETSFRKKISRLPGMRLSNFLVAFDADDNVVGCLAPWSGAGTQDFIPLSYGLQAHNFRQFLKFFSVTGMTRKLAKPVASTGVENKLQFRYLTNVFSDNEDIFESLLYRAYEMSSDNEFLLYAHTEQDYRLLPPESWISSALPFALYAVTPPEKEIPAFLHPGISQNPEIEAFSVL